MSLQSQCLCGFPEGTVEMREARLRALTLNFHDFIIFHVNSSVEMREARLRALTP